MLGPKTVRLIEVLDETVAFLEAQDESFGSSKLRRSRKLLEQEDFRGIQKLLSLFGGMGSFGDFMFSPVNGNAATQSEADRLNSQLGKLTNEIGDLAGEIHREVVSR